MNREHWKSVLPFIQAFVDKKMVEHNASYVGWIPLGDNPSFGINASRYRIVEPPKLRPWKREEVPLDAWFRPRGDKGYLIERVDHIAGSEVYLTVTGLWTLEGLFKDREHSTDGGKTWHPCGVMEGGTQ